MVTGGVISIVCQLSILRSRANINKTGTGSTSAVVDYLFLRLNVLIVVEEQF